jgi:hypothetical protein
MTQLEIELLAALRGVLATDGHDRDCPKRKKSSDRACSLRCTQARSAVKTAQAQMLTEHSPENKKEK